jgi:hypothetical protein
MRWASNCLSKMQEIKKLRARVWVNRKQQQFGVRSQFQRFSTPLTIKATMMKIQAQLATRVPWLEHVGESMANSMGSFLMCVWKMYSWSWRTRLTTIGPRQHLCGVWSCPGVANC